MTGSTISPDSCCACLYVYVGAPGAHCTFPWDLSENAVGPLCALPLLYFFTSCPSPGWSSLPGCAVHLYCRTGPTRGISMEVEDARALCPPSLPSESAPGSPEAHSVKQESIWGFPRDMSPSHHCWEARQPADIMAEEAER